MGTVAGFGITHFPTLAKPDSAMANRLKWALDDPDIPAEVKDPQSWPAGMAAEWASDEGLAAAERHRAAVRKHTARVRAELDEFAPDVVVIWGDDQYELFRDDIIPPFCVLAVDEFRFQPWGNSASGAGTSNVWGEPADKEFVVKGSNKIGRQLAEHLLNNDFDASYAYKLREDRPFPHAFGYSTLFLDYERQGFDHTLLPISLNCYGRNVIARHAGASTFNEIAALEMTDPPSPTPQRAMKLGAEIARFFKASPYRAALVASSSWSHAFLNEGAWHLHPDMDSDTAYYEALESGNHERWHGAKLADVEASGQQEMLNWFALLGAVEEAGLSRSWSEFVPTYIFNSNKCFASYR